MRVKCGEGSKKKGKIIIPGSFQNGGGHMAGGFSGAELKPGGWNKRCMATCKQEPTGGRGSSRDAAVPCSTGAVLRVHPFHTGVQW